MKGGRKEWVLIGVCSPFHLDQRMCVHVSDRYFVVFLLQVSLQKGYNVILKDNFETGLAKGYQYVHKG